MDRAILTLCLLGLIVLATANGPNMERGTDQECKIALKCYDRCGHGMEGVGEEIRECFFDCLEKRPTSKVSKPFRKDVKEVFEWCKEKKRPDGNDSKRMKCTIKKVKKDACRRYWRDQRD